MPFTIVEIRPQIVRAWGTPWRSVDVDISVDGSVVKQFVRIDIEDAKRNAWDAREATTKAELIAHIASSGSLDGIAALLTIDAMGIAGSANAALVNSSMQTLRVLV